MYPDEVVVVVVVEDEIVIAEIVIAEVVIAERLKSHNGSNSSTTGSEVSSEHGSNAAGILFGTWNRWCWNRLFGFEVLVLESFWESFSNPRQSHYGVAELYAVKK